VLAFSSFAGLSQTQYPILIAIQEFDGRRRNRINQLAERLYLTGASVAREVNSLVSDGLIEKPHTQVMEDECSLPPLLVVPRRLHLVESHTCIPDKSAH
jgi:hypothetical protein